VVITATIRDAPLSWTGDEGIASMVVTARCDRRHDEGVLRTLNRETSGAATPCFTDTGGAGNR
jgi:hypothetical protein